MMSGDQRSEKRSRYKGNKRAREKGEFAGEGLDKIPGSVVIAQVSTIGILLAQ